MTKKAPETKEAQPGIMAEELAGELSNVIQAGLGVGAGLAKTVARATASGREVPEPDPATSPLRAIAHYGMATAMNIINVVTTSVSEANNGSRRDRQTAPPTGAGPKAAGAPAPAQPALPSVRRGATLRVPLSIENPGSEPMTDLRFICSDLQGGSGEGTALAAKAIRLEPAVMSVAGHDFEKLTVFVTAPADCALGRYQARIGLKEGGFETNLEFEVLPAAD